MTNSGNINAALKPYLTFVDSIAVLVGDSCEVLLLDAAAPGCSVVACVNTHVTGRTLGDPMTAFDRKLIQSEEYADKDGLYNFFTETVDGRKLKCSVIFLRDKKRKLIGLINVNIDVSRVEIARAVLDDFLTNSNQLPGSNWSSDLSDKGARAFQRKLPPKPEKFGKDSGDALGCLLQEFNISPGAPVDRLSPSELKNLIKMLDSGGFFLIKGSINILAQGVHKSRHTIYSYLRKIKAEEEESSADR